MRCKQAVDLNLLPIAYYSHFNDDTDNILTCSDRVYYGRRKSSTRDRVNWYRGAANRTDLPAGQNDTTTGPTQKTHYDTSDDPTADPDNPAADGNGSRHNYTVIGQVGHTYDKNRNVLADGTREFRYNYKNQLRHVWRKSDGDTVNTGTLAKYREDAFGRRVYAESYWELSRRVYLDTRFELDVNVDADNDGAAMVYVDGGITSNLAPPPGQLDQKSSWDSRIRRNPALLNEAWYFDFLVDVPIVGDGLGLGTYIGFVSYDIYELRIYGNGYELWNTQTSTSLGTHWMFSGTAGRHNIGIRAGVNGGVWVDGAQLTLPGLILTNNVPVTAGFGTHGIGFDNTNGLVLLENLNYIRSYNRADPDEQAPTLGTPRVTVTNFDGPRPVRVDEPFYNGSSVQTLKAVNYTEDATRADHNHGGVEGTELYLPNGRRTTGLVITPTADQVTYADGVRTVIEDPLPGVAKMTHVDAVGAVTCFDRIDMTGALQQPFNTPTTTFDYDATYNWDMVSILFGPAEPVTTQSAMISGVASGVASASDVDVSALGCFNCDNGECACRYASPELPTTSVGRFDIYSGMLVDDEYGNGVDLTHGIMFSGPTPGISPPPRGGIEVFGDVDGEGRGGHARGRARIAWEEEVERDKQAYERCPALRQSAPSAPDWYGSSKNSGGSSTTGDPVQDFAKYSTLAAIDVASIWIGIALAYTGYGSVFGVVGIVGGFVAAIAHGTLALDAIVRMGGGDLLGDTGRQVVDLIGTLANIVQVVSGLGGIAKSIPGLISFAKSIGSAAGAARVALAGAGEATIGGAVAVEGAAGLIGTLDDIINAMAGITGVSRSALLKEASSSGPAKDNYRGRYQTDLYNRGKSRLPDDWDVHHRIPQRYRDHSEFKDFDFDDPSNLRGVKGCRSDNNIHQGITNEWEEFARKNPNATRKEIEDFANNIDKNYGSNWWKG